MGSTYICAMHWCGTKHWNTQLPILMCWVTPDLEILPRPSIHEVNAQPYDNSVVVAVSQKLGRECTVPSES